MARKIYLVGSLRNQNIPDVGNALREAGHAVFEDWFAAGEKADDAWQAYEQGRGHSFIEALDGNAAKNVFDFDMRWLNWADTGILVLPAGKSAHMELGRLEGRGCDVHILLDEEPPRFDVMYKMARVWDTLSTLLKALEPTYPTTCPECSALGGHYTTCSQLGQAKRAPRWATVCLECKVDRKDGADHALWCSQNPASSSLPVS